MREPDSHGSKSEAGADTGAEAGAESGAQSSPLAGAGEAPNLCVGRHHEGIDAERYGNHRTSDIAHQPMHVTHGSFGR